MINGIITIHRGAPVIVAEQHAEIAAGTPALIKDVGDGMRVELAIERRAKTVRLIWIGIQKLRFIDAPTYNALRDRLTASLN